LSVRTIGFNEFRTKLNNLPKNMEKVVGDHVRDAALDWEQRAKNAAPVDQGSVARGITSAKTGPMQATVYSNSQHSRFMEFGTKRRKKVPPELTSYESSLQYSKTGDYYDFLNSILDWVKRKGIGVTYSVATRRKNRQPKDEYLAIAQAIADSIIRNGVRPHPFFFKQKPLVEKELMEKVERYLNTPQ